MSKRWYVVHAYSGFEKSVQRTLEERITRAGMQDKFGRILVPVEEVVEMKSGQKHMSERKFFPGYVLVEMEMDDDTWHLVKNTNKVTGFIGGSAHKPTPITQKEVDKIMDQMREGGRKAQAQGSVRERRDGSGQGRSVHRLPGHGRGRELRQEPDTRGGHDFRALDARRARVLAGGEDLDGEENYRLH